MVCNSGGLATNDCIDATDALLHISCSTNIVGTEYDAASACVDVEEATFKVDKVDS